MIDKSTIFVPAYDFHETKSIILLSQCQVNFCIDESIYKGVGEVRLELKQSAAIIVDCKFDTLAPGIANKAIDDPESASLSINGHAIIGFCKQIDFSMGDSTIQLKWCPRTEPISIVDESSQISTLVFHLFNFVQFIGTSRSRVKIDGSIHLLEHLSFSSDVWEIDIKSQVCTRDNFKALNCEGGFQLTHVGQIQRLDGESFSAKEATEILNILGVFLSFVKGGWCAPVCTVGFDNHNQRIWEVWSSPREPEHYASSWFDIHHGSQVESLFPVFMER